MTVSGAQAAAFFREAVRHRVVWWVRDDEGAPTWPSRSGAQVVPYWSSDARAERAVAIWGARFRAMSMPLRHWQDVELPDLAAEGLRVGINWSGHRLTGWDFTVEEVRNRLAHALGEPPYDTAGSPHDG